MFIQTACGIFQALIRQLSSHMMNTTGWQKLAQTEENRVQKHTGLFIPITVLMLQKTFDTAAVHFYKADSLLLMLYLF